jgi:hypothetical protein
MRKVRQKVARRWAAVVITAAATAATCISASALAAAGAQPTNNRVASGPVRPARPAPSAPVREPAANSTKTVTHHYSLAASAFTPDGLHDTTEDYFNQWDPTTLTNMDPGRCFNAGLSLPVNATLKSARFYYTAGSTAMFFELNRQDLVNHSAGEMVADDTTTAATPTYTSQSVPIPAVYAAVDMAKYAYSVGVCPSGSTTFSGLIITYTVPAS